MIIVFKIYYLYDVVNHCIEKNTTSIYKARVLNQDCKNAARLRFLRLHTSTTRSISRLTPEGMCKIFDTVKLYYKSYTFGTMLLN